jgi:hypothetical protein
MLMVDTNLLLGTGRNGGRGVSHYPARSPRTQPRSSTIQKFVYIRGVNVGTEAISSKNEFTEIDPIDFADKCN